MYYEMLYSLRCLRLFLYKWFFQMIILYRIQNLSISTGD